MRTLTEQLERVRAMLAFIDRHERLTSTELRRRLKAEFPEARDHRVWCRSCCLPLTRHVAHDPPGLIRPVDGAYSSTARPWREAVRRLYGSALAALKAEELASMPLPVAGLYLACLADELTERTRALAPTLWERLDREDSPPGRASVSLPERPAIDPDAPEPPVSMTIGDAANYLNAAVSGGTEWRDESVEAAESFLRWKRATWEEPTSPYDGLWRAILDYTIDALERHRASQGVGHAEG